MVQKSRDHQLILGEFLPLKSIIFPRVLIHLKVVVGWPWDFWSISSHRLENVSGGLMNCIGLMGIALTKALPWSKEKASRPGRGKVGFFFFWVTVLTVKPGWQVIWIDAICFFPMRTFEQLIRKHGCVTCFHVFFGKHGCFFFGGDPLCTISVFLKIDLARQDKTQWQKTVVGQCEEKIQ